MAGRWILWPRELLLSGVVLFYEVFDLCDHIYVLFWGFYLHGADRERVAVALLSVIEDEGSVLAMCWSDFACGFFSRDSCGSYCFDLADHSQRTIQLAISGHYRCVPSSMVAADATIAQHQNSLVLSLHDVLFRHILGFPFAAYLPQKCHGGRRKRRRNWGDSPDVAQITRHC